MRAKINGYYNFLKNITTQSLLPQCNVIKQVDLQTIKNDCVKIINANQRLVNDYKNFSCVIPPAKYSIIHQKFLNVYYELFGILFRFTDDIEKIGTLSMDQLREQWNNYGEFKITMSTAQFAQAIDELNVAFTQVRKKGCFIATAAYGTSVAQEINVLRAFRDRRLELTPLGRQVVLLYYLVSPPIAEIISHSNRMRASIRHVLHPIILMIRRMF